MSILDIIIIGIFLISIVVGIMRGFVKEVLSLIYWIAAFYLAITFGADVGQYLSKFVGINTPMFVEWGGRVVVFIGTLFVGAILTFFIVKMLRHKAVKGVDRMLGIATGAIRAIAIIVAIIIFAGRGFSLDETDWWKGSKLIGAFNPISLQIEKLLPEDWQSTKEQQEEQPSIQDAIIDGAIENFKSKLDVPESESSGSSN